MKFRPACLLRNVFIEKAGTGIRKMRDGARELGYPEPTFAEDTFFTALFRPITLKYSKLLLQFRNRGKSCKRQRQSKIGIGPIGQMGPIGLWGRRRGKNRSLTAFRDDKEKRFGMTFTLSEDCQSEFPFFILRRYAGVSDRPF